MPAAQIFFALDRCAGIDETKTFDTLVFHKPVEVGYVFYGDV
jgi:hypothetical protein